MKFKILLPLIALFFSSFIVYGSNGDDDRKKKKDVIRSERQVAISAESGWRTLSGVGVNVSYFATPKLGLDLGAGLSYFGVKTGARARVLFSEKNFSPYVGLGLSFANSSAQDIQIDDTETGAVYFLDMKSSLFGQALFGLEYISNGGFYIGWNIGYAPSLKENYEFQTTPSDFAESVARLTFGGSISTALNIGYAF